MRSGSCVHLLVAFTLVSTLAGTAPGLAAMPAGRAQVAQGSETEWPRSDPALLSKTGRPQLVEFFHPN